MMSSIDVFGVLGILLSILCQTASTDFCNGAYCSMNQYCCGNRCCNTSYSYSFWNLWYFWFVMFIIMMSCCGMCSYAKRRQYYGQQHNQIIIPAGRGRMTNITTTSYPVGVTAPPAAPVHQHQPPQAYQSPPPYSEVTSKPDLYPAYQGAPTQMPYPTQQYAYPPQFQPQPMYPPQANYQNPQPVSPAPAPTGPQPPPYTTEANPPPSSGVIPTAPSH